MGDQLRLDYYLQFIKRFLVIEFDSVSHAEKLIATIGGVIGITLVSYISFQVSGARGAALIVPSMGATAVLLFAVPHGKLSQPWALLGGHVFSAFVGVACFKLFGDTYIAAGFAVGFAIGIMHVFNCIHPPGGATALAAVIGGPAIHDLGFQYVLSPILLNAIVILSIAIMFNGLFAWRRYPAMLMMRFTDKPKEGIVSYSDWVDKNSIEQALTDMDIVMDVTIEDLQRVIHLSLENRKHYKLTAEQIKLDHYYTNGKPGAEWSVRHIIDESYSVDKDNDFVIYREVEGQRFNAEDSCTRQAFAEWAAREVFQNVI